MMETERRTALRRTSTLVLLEGLELLRQSDHRCYDYSDYWATRPGRTLKSLAYRYEPLGNVLFAAPVMALEVYAPWARRAFGLPKRVYPISVAHHGLACVNLATALEAEEFLWEARQDLLRLLDLATDSGAGPSWGFPFVWPTNQGVVPANVPAATQSAYGFDLVDALWRVTGDTDLLGHLEGIARAMDEEYRDLARTVGIASTYHGRGYGDVVLNAVTYRIHIGAPASAVLGEARHLETAQALTDYVLSSQNQDGSWYYGESSKNQFIDHYHTAFVLKNLARANQAMRRSDVKAAIRKGIAFYWSRLFDGSGLPRPFARSVRFNPVRYESYDFAECLGLFSLFGPDEGFSDEALQRVLSGFLAHLMLPSGAVRFRVYRVPAPAGVPYYRYGMSAALLALASLLTTRLAPEVRNARPAT